MRVYSTVVFIMFLCFVVQWLRLHHGHPQEGGVLHQEEQLSQHAGRQEGSHADDEKNSTKATLVYLNFKGN